MYQCSQAAIQALKRGATFGLPHDNTTPRIQTISNRSLLSVNGNGQRAPTEASKRPLQVLQIGSCRRTSPEDTLRTSGARLIDIWSLLREASSRVDTVLNSSCEHASSSANFMVSATKQRCPSLAQGISFRHTQGRSLLRVGSLRGPPPPLAAECASHDESARKM